MTLSLLCSEWEEVGHVTVKHEQTKISVWGTVEMFPWHTEIT